MVGKDLARLLPDVADAEREQQARKVAGFGIGNAYDQVVCGFFAHALKLLDLRRFQRVEVGR